MKTKQLLSMALAAALFVTAAPVQAGSVVNDSTAKHALENEVKKIIGNETLPVSVTDLPMKNGQYYLANPGSSILLESSVEEQEGVSYKWKMHKQRYLRSFYDYSQEVKDIELNVNAGSYTINSLDYGCVYTCTASDAQGTVLKEDVFYIQVNTGLAESLPQTQKELVLVSKGGTAELKTRFIKLGDEEYEYYDYEAPNVLEVSGIKLTYQWYVDEDAEPNGHKDYRALKEKSGATEKNCTTDPITKYVQYAVLVSDNYGNTAVQYVDVSVASGLRVDNNAKHDFTIKVEGESLTLKSTATANSDEKLTYSWSCMWEDGTRIELKPEGGFTELWFLPSYDSVQEKGENESCMNFGCTIEDTYGYKVYEEFYVYPDSGLVVSGEENKVTEVTATKCSQKITMNAKTEYGPLHYKWAWYSKEENDEHLDETDLDTDKDSIEIEKEGYYWCRVSDQYNSAIRTFHVTIDSAAEGYHTYGDWETKRPATVQSEGEEIRICKDCGHIDSKKVPKVVVETPKTDEKKDPKSDSGSSTVTTPVQITVGAAKVTGAKNKKSKQVAITISSVEGAAGYEVTYADNKKFKKAKKKTIKGTSLTLKRLKKGKTYYIKVCAYKLDATGKKVYGELSGAKKVKIKK